MKKLLPLIFFLWTTVWAQSCPPQALCASNSLWNNPNHLTIDFQVDEPQVHLALEAWFHDEKNISIEMSGEQGGRLKLINGKLLLTQGIDFDENHMIDALDGVALNTALVMNLLQAAYEKGPAQLKEPVTAEVKDQNRSLIAGTRSASANIPPPWQLSAEIQPEPAADHPAFRYRLLLHINNRQMRISGLWEQRSTPPVLDADMPLQGWQVYTLGPRTFRDGSSTIYDYGTTLLDTPAKTLSELIQSQQAQTP